MKTGTLQWEQGYPVMKTGIPCGNWLIGSFLWALQGLGLQWRDPYFIQSIRKDFLFIKIDDANIDFLLSILPNENRNSVWILIFSFLLHTTKCFILFSFYLRQKTHLVCKIYKIYFKTLLLFNIFKQPSIHKNTFSIQTTWIPCYLIFEIPSLNETSLYLDCGLSISIGLNTFLKTKKASWYVI